MPYRIVISLLLCLGFQALSAQDQVDCRYMLDDAREAYNAGMVELVPEILLDCIESNGITGDPRKEAYKLVLNSYIFDYRTVEADSLMDHFVAEFPDYRSENSDPQQFVSMLNAHLRARGIDPDQPLYTEMEEDSTFRRFFQRTITKGAGEYGNSAGFVFGIPLSLPYTIEGYSVGDPTADDSHFGLLPGLRLGGTGNLILSSKFEASLGLVYDLTRFSYSAAPLTYTSYRYVEAQHRIMLPVSAIYKLNPEDMRMCYYLRGGIEPGYLLYASGKGTRTYEASLDDLQVGRTAITDARKHFNINAFIGGGIRIPFENAFVYVEAGLSSGLWKSNREGEHYQNNDLTWLLYHVDSDFRLRQLSISGGICWDLTRTIQDLTKEE